MSLITKYCQLAQKITNDDQEYPTTNHYQPLTQFLATLCTSYGVCIREKFLTQFCIVSAKYLFLLVTAVSRILPIHFFSCKVMVRKLPPQGDVDERQDQFKSSKCGQKVATRIFEYLYEGFCSKMFVVLPRSDFHLRPAQLEEALPRTSLYGQNPKRSICCPSNTC